MAGGSIDYVVNSKMDYALTRDSMFILGFSNCIALNGADRNKYPNAEGYSELQSDIRNSSSPKKMLDRLTTAPDRLISSTIMEKGIKEGQQFIAKIIDDLAAGPDKKILSDDVALFRKDKTITPELMENVIAVLDRCKFSVFKLKDNGLSVAIAPPIEPAEKGNNRGCTYIFKHSLSPGNYSKDKGYENLQYLKEDITGAIADMSSDLKASLESGKNITLSGGRSR